MDFEEISMEELGEALAKNEKEKTTRTRKPKYDVSDRTIPAIGSLKWFKLPHTIDHDCTYCGANRMTFKVELLDPEEYADKYMCRLCFLSGVEF